MYAFVGTSATHFSSTLSWCSGIPGHKPNNMCTCTALLDAEFDLALLLCLDFSVLLLSQGIVQGQHEWLRCKLDDIHGMVLHHCHGHPVSNVVHTQCQRVCLQTNDEGKRMEGSGASAINDPHRTVQHHCHGWCSVIMVQRHYHQPSWLTLGWCSVIIMG